jgi:hypothetical protein
VHAAAEKRGPVFGLLLFFRHSDGALMNEWLDLGHPMGKDHDSAMIDE